ncbi:9452_t:CDS:1, partial [Gigaspora margarita]
MNQIINQVVGGQPLPVIPQNANTNANNLVNPSFDNFTAYQKKYEDLIKGTDPFIKSQRTENQAIQFSTVIFS